MRISAQPTLGALSPYSGIVDFGGPLSRGALLIEKFSKGISVGATLGLNDPSFGSNSELDIDRDSVLARINLLIEEIQKRSLESSTVRANGSGAAKSAAGQRAIDEALLEVGRLI